MTQKTEQQNQELKKAIPESADSTSSYDTSENFHTQMSPPFQAATHAFREKILSDKTLMSPLLRKYIPHGLKQAFVVKREIKNDTGQTTHHQWSSRSGTIAYVGKGEFKESMQLAANENLTQLEKNVTRVINEHGTPDEKNKVLRFNFTILNTDSPLETQDRMIAMTRTATAEKNKSWEFSYTPVNAEGRQRCRLIFTSDELRNAAGWSFNFLPTSRAKQSVRAGMAFSNFNAKDKQININHRACASGIDRTGTGELYTSWQWIQEQRPDLDKTHIIKKITEGGDAQTMAHILYPSSPGMKADSRPGLLFGREFNKHLYLDSALQNKKTPIEGYQKKKLSKEKLAALLLIITATLVSLILVEAVFAAGLTFSIIVALMLYGAVKPFEKITEDPVSAIASVLGIALLLTSTALLVGEFALSAGAGIVFATVWEAWAGIVTATSVAPILLPVLLTTFSAITLVGLAYFAREYYVEKS